jgi:hypothetical protein
MDAFIVYWPSFIPRAVHVGFVVDKAMHCTSPLVTSVLLCYFAGVVAADTLVAQIPPLSKKSGVVHSRYTLLVQAL